MIFAKIKGYLIAAGAMALALILAFFKGASAQKNKTRVAQKEIELEAHKASIKAEKAANKQTEVNNEKADNGDFSGFNR